MVPTRVSERHYNSVYSLSIMLDNNTSFLFSSIWFYVCDGIFWYSFPDEFLNKQYILDLNCDGIVIDYNDKQPCKHSSPITSTDEGIDTYNNDLHAEKHFLPITLTEDGMLIADSDSHLSKHLL